MSIRSIPALSCPQENQEAVCTRGRCPPSHSSWSSCAWEATEKRGRAGCLSVPGHCRHSVLSLPLFFRALTLTGLQTELRCFDFLLLPGVKRQLQRAAGCSVLSLAMRRHGAGSRWLAPSVLSLLQPGRIRLPAELAQGGGCLEGPAWPLHSITGLEEPVTCADPTVHVCCHRRSSAAPQVPDGCGAPSSRPGCAWGWRCHSTSLITHQYTCTGPH